MVETPRQRRRAGPPTSWYGPGRCPPVSIPTTIRRVGSWLVTFRGGLSDDARGALSAAGTIVTGGHGGGFLGPSGDNLEPLENHTVLVDADTEDDAIGRIRTALEPHDGFGDFTAHESGAPKGRR
jgi:hypothetical protein